MATKNIKGEVNKDEKYVGYLNNSELFIESMFDPEKNPNGIGYIKLNVNNNSLLSAMGEGGLGEFYKDIFMRNNEGISSSVYSEDYPVHPAYADDAYIVMTKTIKFLVNNDINIDGANTWEESIDKIVGHSIGGDSIAASWRKGGVLGTAAALAKGAAGMSGIKLQTLMQTIKFWQGSATPDFDFKFNLVAFRPDTDIRRELLALYAAVYPGALQDSDNSAVMGKSIATIIDNIVSNILSRGLSGFMAAPLGYNPVDAYKSSLNPVTSEDSGLIDIRVGKWLHLPNMVAKSFSATISKATTRFGFPLYATCNLKLQPCRMWTISDIKDIFFSTATSDETSSGREGGVKTQNWGQVDQGKITLVGEMP